jgi:hypothetical protein
MTASFNLAQLANNLNTSGQLDATDGLTGLIANANLASSGTPSSSTFLRGDRTWSTAAIGRIRQVVQTKNSTAYATTSGSLTEINSSLRTSITPLSSSSLIMILFNANVMQGDSDSGLGYIQMYRGVGGTNLTGTGFSFPTGIYTGGGQAGGAYNGNSVFIDAPATTSSITYTPYWAVSFGTYRLNNNRGGLTLQNRGITTLTLMEIEP